MVEKWQNDLKKIAHPEKIKILSSFFKTGKGEYGEGDIFIGVVVPDNRRIAMCYIDSTFGEFSEMLHSPIHEFRLSALLALVQRYKKTKDVKEKQKIIDFYIENADCCNNWDLVDLSAPYLLGNHLLSHPSSHLLDELSQGGLWRQRISLVSTLALIRNGEFGETLRLSKFFLEHKHPLIHKATGWMLREVGKRDKLILLDFLDEYAVSMPRTALRYAIEKLSDEERKYYLNKR